MTSNGQLLAMSEDHRARHIKSLQPAVRLRLANIAALGATKLLKDADKARTVGFAHQKRDKAAQFTKLIAELTGEPKEV